MMKRHILTILSLLLAGSAIAQQRDRRVDLNIHCGYHIDVSTTGRLWIGDRCGNIYTADSMGATWRTVRMFEDYIRGGNIERIAAFGDDIAVAAGYMHGEGFVVRTTSGGTLWDTVQVDPRLIWVHGFCYHSDGRMWMAAASGRQFKYMAFSSDRGRSFTPLTTPFDGDESGEGGIEELYMVTSDSGFAGTYGGDIYSTSDNWRTAHRLFSPLDQGLLKKNTYMDAEVRRIRLWHGWLIATLFQTTAITPTDSDSLHWQLLPWDTYEVDTTSGNLWAITDSGELVYFTDLEHRKVLAKGLGHPFCNIIGILGGCAYLHTQDGVVRISSDGKADTCGFFTREQTLDESFDKLFKEHRSYANEYLPTLSHGGRLWRTDRTSVYLQDALGWYRIAKPLGVSKILPDPDRSNRIIFLRNDEKTYALDTTGHYEPYTYHNPLESFVKSGLQSVEIATHRGGCFHFEEDIIRYTRHGDQLRESANTVDSSKHAPMLFPADILEHTLSQLGETYSRFPTHADFGMKEGDVDLEKVFAPEGGCTSYSGYRITLVNRNGDTLTVHGNSRVDCGGYFPWLLPMNFSWQNAAFVSYQPALWQAIRPMMPKDMILRDKLNNNALLDLRPGDLLFYRDTAGMGAAVRESTGEYTHVALVESVGDTVWIIDATQKYGVSRRPFLRKRNDMRPYPDIYRVEHGCYNIDSVLSRARSFVGQPYDNAFLPNNGALYCSELIYEVFLDDCSAKGRHLFETKPMNWRDKEGKIPQYWQEHFKKLEMEVPEGVPGTNPTDMSRSPLLRKL